MGTLREALAGRCIACRPRLLRKAERIARDRDADRPCPGRPPFCDAGLGIVDLDDRAWRIDPEIGEGTVHHQGRRPALGEVAGADEIVGAIALLGGDRQERRHDLARIAGGRADLEAALPRSAATVSRAPGMSLRNWSPPWH